MNPFFLSAELSPISLSFRRSMMSTTRFSFVSAYISRIVSVSSSFGSMVETSCIFSPLISMIETLLSSCTKRLSASFFTKSLSSIPSCSVFVFEKSSFCFFVLSSVAFDDVSFFAISSEIPPISIEVSFFALS